MNWMDIRTVARYEARLLRRSWLFRIFAGLAFGIIFCAVVFWCTTLIIDGNPRWGQVAITDQVPFFSLFLYNLLQSAIVVFIAGGMAARERKMDTMDVIYARPVGNGEYLWGKVLGILKAFGGWLLVILGLTLLLHLAVGRTPFSAVPYVWYPLTLLLPSFVFVLGMAMAVNQAVKARALALVVSLGIVGILTFYLSGVWHGVLDVFGQTVPMMGSDVTGMADMGAYLLQRAVFLVAGIGFVLLSVAAFKRLPNHPGTAGMRLAGWGCVAGAMLLGGAYVWQFRAAEKRTAEYGAIYDRYADAGQAHVTEQALEVTLDGSRLQGKSLMTVVNAGTEEMEKVVLYLNPGLRVESLTCGQEVLPFEREKQAVIVKRALRAGDTLRLDMEYAGTVDEAVCYTDVPLKERRERQAYKGLYNFGKRYAWVEKGFAQLTPECLWYPTGTAAAHPASPFDIRKDFTRYSLAVEHPEGMTVISQGEAAREAGMTRFANRTPLPGISLTAGEYERMGIEVDSVLYEVYYFRGHDYFREPLAVLRDTMEYFIRNALLMHASHWVKDYPFRKFALVETPAPYHAYIRSQKGYTEFVMPEILFVPEQAYNLEGNDFANEIDWNFMMNPPERRDSTTFARFALSNFLSNLFGERAKEEKRATTRDLSPMFMQHTLFFLSEEYPIMDAVLQKAQGWDYGVSMVLNTGIDYAQRARLYLQEHSLRDALSDPDIDIYLLYTVIQLKSDELLQRIQMEVPGEKFRQFQKDFFREHAFEIISFDTFCKALEQIDSIDMEGMLPQWYNQRGSASVIIRGGEAKRIEGQETELYQVSFKAYNPSEHDAVLSVNVSCRLQVMTGGKTTFGASIDLKKHLLPAGAAYDFRYITEAQPIRLSVNTNISHNMPSEYNFSFSDATSFGTTRDTTEGVFPIRLEAFQPAEGEIIIDNEDPGFTFQESKGQHKLKGLFQKEKEKYSEFVIFRAPAEWTAAIATGCYGDIVRSALYKRKGTGQASATWTTQLPEDGYYEIAVWKTNALNPHFSIISTAVAGRQAEHNYHYLVRYGEEEEAVVIDMAQEEYGWVSLGHFDLPAGEVSVTLTDETTGRYVIADAVKFTRIE